MDDSPCPPAHDTTVSFKTRAPVSFKRMLDGAPFTGAGARRAPLGARARPWDENLTMGSHPTEGRARRGRPVARPWGVGRGEQIPFREHRARRPGYSPHKMNWRMNVRGAAARRLTDRALAAGDSPAGARVVDERPCPPGHKHSASLKATTARQLQALVRQPAPWPSRPWHVARSHDQSCHLG